MTSRVLISEAVIYSACDMGRKEMLSVFWSAEVMESVWEMSRGFISTVRLSEEVTRSVAEIFFDIKPAMTTVSDLLISRSNPGREIPGLSPPVMLSDLEIISGDTFNPLSENRVRESALEMVKSPATGIPTSTVAISLTQVAPSFTVLETVGLEEIVNLSFPNIYRGLMSIGTVRGRQFFSLMNLDRVNLGSSNIGSRCFVGGKDG